jgi:DNA polymerase
MTDHASPTPEERKARLDAIAAEIARCTKCVLHRSRTHTVPGDGPVNAEIMFIGEGPGFHEDQQGLPFVGASGKYLEELLAAIGLSRREVFITNVVKCRPPQNRDPLPGEVEICTKTYLERQIALLNPKIIITLGRYSMACSSRMAKSRAFTASPNARTGASTILCTIRQRSCATLTCAL